MSIRINIFYQYAVLLIGFLCLIIGVTNKDYLLLVLGALLVSGAFGTIKHIITGKHNRNSKLPKDINIE